MKLYIKEKVFSWNDKFTIKDEYGQDKYYVEGELFSFGKKLHVYDMVGREVAFIQQKVFSFLPKYFVFVNGTQVAEIVKEFTFLFPKYSIEGLGWSIEGRFMEHDYEIKKNGYTIVTIHKEWVTWGDCYELNIQDSQDEIIALAVVLAIDCVTESNNSGVSVDVGN
ncbi:MAG: LURP-one-related family protein [Lachnospiraceae bacterium]|nr:LURP-one-related family protein [Lachnospiraceae bacterium]